MNSDYIVSLSCVLRDSLYANSFKNAFQYVETLPSDRKIREKAKSIISTAMVAVGQTENALKIISKLSEKRQTKAFSLLVQHLLDMGDHIELAKLSQRYRKHLTKSMLSYLKIKEKEILEHKTLIQYTNCLPLEMILYEVNLGRARTDNMEDFAPLEHKDKIMSHLLAGVDTLHDLFTKAHQIREASPSMMKNGYLFRLLAGRFEVILNSYRL